MVSGMMIFSVEVCSEYHGERTEDHTVYSCEEKAQTEIDRELKETNCVYVCLTRLDLVDKTFRHTGESEFFDGPAR